MEQNLHLAEQAALQYVDAHQQELFEMLSRLVQFDSQNLNGDGKERECAEYLATQYRALGLETDLYCPDSVPGVVESPLYWPNQNTDKRPNVSGILRGETEELVMLAAHTDTMPYGDMDAWELSPFSGAIRDGKIYGLGVSDNKFGLAGSYFVLKAFSELGIRLKKSVVLAAYCAEEFGGGNGALGSCLHDPCETCVNLDGGSYEMWASALGGGCYRIDLHRTETTDNWEYIYETMSAMIDRLRVFGARRRDELEQNPLYTGTDTAKSAFRLGKFGAVGESHLDASVEFVIYTDRSREQIAAELRDIMEELQPVLRKNKVVSEGFQATTRFFDYGECDQQSAPFQIMKQCAQEAAGKPVRVCGSCLTDLAIIQACGKVENSFNFGILREFSLPGGAHQPNEFVECQQFVEHTKAMALFLLRYCGMAEQA